MKYQQIITTATLLILLAGACSNNPPTQVPIEDKLAQVGFILGEQVKRVNNFQINSWNMVDRQNAILYVGASRRYLVTTRTPCDGLEDARNLNYSTTAGSLTDKDKLLARRLSGRLESCFIDTIYELEKIRN